MFCIGCGQQGTDQAAFCFKCGARLGDGKPPSPGSPTLARGSRSVLTNVLGIRFFGLLASAVGGMFLFAAVRLFSPSNPIPASALGFQGLLLVATGLAILSKHPKAVALLWTTTVIVAIGVVNRGITPIDLLLWVCQLGFTIWYQRIGSATALPEVKRWSGVAVASVFVVFVSLTVWSGVGKPSSETQNRPAATGDYVAAAQEGPATDRPPAQNPPTVQGFRFDPQYHRMTIPMTGEVLQFDGSLWVLQDKHGRPTTKAWDGQQWVSTAPVRQVSEPPHEATVGDLKEVYKQMRTQLPPHSIACFPEKKQFCDNGSCRPVPLGVFNVVDGQFSKFSRCDRTSGCDTYETTVTNSGAFVNLQMKEPRGTLMKVDLKERKFVEVATALMGTYISWGTCENVQETR